MVLLDKDGYYYGPNHWTKVQIISALFKIAKEDKRPVSQNIIADLIEKVDINYINDWIKDLRPAMTHDLYLDTFFDFCNRDIDGRKSGELTDNSIAKGDFPHGNDINAMLMAFHNYRFIKAGMTTYKLRYAKALHIMSHTLCIPAYLLILPFKEFMISLPMGCLRTNQGSMVNIFVSEEPFKKEVYLNSQYEVSESIRRVITENEGRIKRIIRCYGISMPDHITEESEAKTCYYQFPVIEDVDIQKQFSELVDGSDLALRDPVIKMFNLMLNFCAWLTIGDRDIEKKLGVIRKPGGHNPKKIRVANRENMLSSYNYFDVGRVYDTRYQNDMEIGMDGEGRRILKRIFVRAYLRAQWYGSREGGVKGTEQKIILVKEHEKGDDLDLKPKIMEAL